MVAPTSLLVSLAHDLVLLLRRQGTDAKVKRGIVGLLEDLALQGEPVESQCWSGDGFDVTAPPCNARAR